MLLPNIKRSTVTYDLTIWPQTSALRLPYNLPNLVLEIYSQVTLHTNYYFGVQLSMLISDFHMFGCTPYQLLLLNRSLPE